MSRIEPEQVERYFTHLQDTICSALENVDGQASFVSDLWQRDDTQLTGGGDTRVLSDGRVFERFGINFSRISGSQLPAAATAKRPEMAGRGYVAMGISLVGHPLNPYVPTVHMNLRYFSTLGRNSQNSDQNADSALFSADETKSIKSSDQKSNQDADSGLLFAGDSKSIKSSGQKNDIDEGLGRSFAGDTSNIKSSAQKKDIDEGRGRSFAGDTSNIKSSEQGDLDTFAWFGGGFDLTPYYGFEEDAIHWHDNARSACEPFGEDLYPRYKRECDEYFYLPHRQETRGIGGLFFDDLNEPDLETSFHFAQSVGDHFLTGYLPIAERRKDTPYGQRERDFQLYRRGRYVEFNLVYDRGTLFGLQSGGRTESILMSLPPLVSWRYQWAPEPGSAEADLYENYLRPREWLKS